MDDNKNPKSQIPNSNSGQQGNDSGQARMTVTGGKKEMSPMGNEWVSASSPEIVMPSEVEKAGVVETQTIPTIPPAMQAAGVRPAKEATPVSPVKAEPLGMATPRSVLDNLKNVHKSWKDAMSWLVRTIIKEQDKEKNHPTQSRYD